MDEVITASGASSSSFRSASSRPSMSPPSNVPLLAAFLAFALAQLLKLFTLWFTEKRWDSGRILGSGGMPSAHSATVTALAVAIGLHEGAGSPTFAVALVLACIRQNAFVDEVMYDASGVRLHAGRQAEQCKQRKIDSEVRPLQGSLGHTPLQVVAGACLGCFIALLTNSTTGIYG